MKIKKKNKRQEELQEDVPNLPALAPASDGAIMRSAGKYARQSVMSVYHMLGGDEAMAKWAEANKGDYYTKLFPKIIKRETEEIKSDSVEDLLEAIDAEVEEVPSAQDAEFEPV